MYSSGWNKLIKSNDGYKYEPKASFVKEQCSAKFGFTQMSFDYDEDYLIVADIKGYLHCLELSEGAPCYKIMGNVGRPTFLAFNPLCRGEMLIGLDTGDIKIWKLHTEVDKFCLLSSHKQAPLHISFCKNYCLTSSRNEVIIWNLQSYNKAHQLKINKKDALIKKTAFSNAGHIVVLYHNDTIQIWTLGQLHKDIKINTKIFGTRYIKDIIFTKDGRTMIIADTKDIKILNTYDWSLLKKLCLSKNFVDAKQLSIIPRPLDGGANKIIAFLSSKCTLQFYDMDASIFLEAFIPIDNVKRFIISSTGRYIAYIDQEGCLNIMHIDKVISKRYPQPKRILEHKLYAHKISDHLKYIRQNVKQELNIKRLIPILKEFGEYPGNHRILIWSTILKLPVNKDAYIALTSKAMHGKLTLNTLRLYPLADRSKASLLATTIDCLFQWCPLLIQSPFLPKLIFPFLVVFQKNPLLAFELILSILLNYCQKWFEYHPLPPLNILGIIENILMETDPILLNTFCEYGITTSEYAWPLLQTMMSEVLSGNEWLILWDHLISFQMPSLLLMCVVAYSIHSRENIISLIRSSKDIKVLYNTQSHIRAKDLLKIAKRLNQEISQRVHPNCYLRDKLSQLNHIGPYCRFMQKEYPTFFVENSGTSDLEKSTVQQSQEHNHKIAEFAEKRRLHMETEAFKRQIHKIRLNEIQKCSQDHRSNLDSKLLRNVGKEKFCCHHLYKERDNLKSQRTQGYSEYKTIIDRASISEEAELRNLIKLKKDVTKLEYEIQNFLDSSCRSKVDVS